MEKTPDMASGNRERTMGDIAARYDAQRAAILDAIGSGRVSASMSGIEYCNKPWADLDLENDSDRAIISAALTWDGEQHDLTELRKLTGRELALTKERTALSYLPWEERAQRMAEINAELKQLGAHDHA